MLCSISDIKPVQHLFGVTDRENLTVSPIPSAAVRQGSSGHLLCRFFFCTPCGAFVCCFVGLCLLLCVPLFAVTLVSVFCYPLRHGNLCTYFFVCLPALLGFFFSVLCLFLCFFRTSAPHHIQHWKPFADECTALPFLCKARRHPCQAGELEYPAPERPLS